MVRFRTTIAAIAFASMALLTPTVSAQSQGAFDNCLKIVAFGSSSTEGVGASSKARSYPSQLAVLLSKGMPKGRTVTVVNRGIGGEDAAAMEKRLDKDVIARRPDLVVWQTGSNDPMTHNPLPRFERETREGIRAMQAAGIEVILMEPQWAPHLEKISTANLYRDAVRKIGVEMHVVVIRRSDLMHDWVKRGLMTQKQMLSDDGLHMSDKGYRALANCVADEVRKTEAYRKLPRNEMATTAVPIRS